MPEVSLEVIFDRISEVQDSLQELRNEVHNRIGEQANRITALEEWRVHQNPVVLGNAAKVDRHEMVLNEVTGGMRMFKVLGSVILALVTVFELVVHYIDRPVREVTSASVGGK